VKINRTRKTRFRINSNKRENRKAEEVAHPKPKGPTLQKKVGGRVFTESGFFWGGKAENRKGGKRKKKAWGGVC